MERRPFVVEGRRRLLAAADGAGARGRRRHRLQPSPLPRRASTSSWSRTSWTGWCAAPSAAGRRARPRIVTAAQAPRSSACPSRTARSTPSSARSCSARSPTRTGRWPRSAACSGPAGGTSSSSTCGSDDPALARRQDRLERLWRTVTFGCHPNRETLRADRGGVRVEDGRAQASCRPARGSSGRTCWAARVKQGQTPRVCHLRHCAPRPTCLRGTAPPVDDERDRWPLPAGASAAARRLGPRSRRARGTSARATRRCRTSSPRGRSPTPSSHRTGATSVETKPVLMPTIPYSSPSETRQTRPTSRL